jgi:hypothetical protein
MDNETNGHKETKGSTDEIHETQSRIQLLDHKNKLF